MPRGIPTKQKHCAICNEMFLPTCPANKICPKDHFTSCPICGKQVVWNSTRPVDPCSKECKEEKRRRDCQAKYGVDHPMQCESVKEHHRESMRRTYGVDSPMQSEEIKKRAIASNQRKFGVDWAISADSVRERSYETMRARYGAATTFESPELTEKVRSTLLSSYGVDNAMKSEEVRSRSQSTLKERYGVDNPMKVDDFKEKSVDSRRSHIHDIVEKSKETWIKSLGVDNPSKSPDVIDKIDHTFMKRYGVKRAMSVPEFRKKYEATMIDRYGVPYAYMMQDSSAARISSVNKRFGELLDRCDIPYEYEYRIGSKFYDIRILNQNVVIEIDPTYTHNTIGNHWNDGGLAETYHFEKSKLAESEGFRCIHIFDWDDTQKIVGLLNLHTQLYARKLVLEIVPIPEANQFLDLHHIQGTCRGGDLAVALKAPSTDEIVQIMLFGSPRYNRNYEVELLRFASKSGYRIIGGASKLFKFAVRSLGPCKMISYCDLAKFTGNVYTQLGMKLETITQPQEIWSRGSDYITANLLRGRGFDQLFNTDYGKEFSNELLMLEHGWLPVYDCGQAVFSYQV